MIYLILSLIVVAGIAFAIYTHSNKIEIKKCTCLNFTKCNSENCSCDQNCRCYDNELANENLGAHFDSILDEEEPIIEAVIPIVVEPTPVIEEIKIEIPKAAEPKKKVVKKAEPQKAAIKKKPKKK